MANNTTLNTGSGGDVIGDLDVGGVKYQQIIGAVAQDAALTSYLYPLIGGGRASAAAPSDVSTDADSVISWHLKNGAQAVNLTAAGALIGGNATNGLQVYSGTAAGDLGKAEDAAHNSGDTGVMSLAVQKATPADVSTDGDYAPIQVSGGSLWIRQAPTIVRLQTDITRPADTTAYAANDCWSDSTSAPTSGGFTFTGAARVSGGGGTVLSATFNTSADASTLLQAECHLFTTSVTNINDNSAFAVSDAEIKTWLGKIYFSMFDAGNNGACHVSGVGISYVCSGSANLRYLIRVINAYTPVSGEVLTCSLVCAQDG